MTTKPKEKPTHCPKCQTLLTITESPFAVAAKCEKCEKTVWVGQRTAVESLAFLAAQQGIQPHQTDLAFTINVLCFIIDTRDQMLREEIRRFGMQVDRLPKRNTRKGG